MTNDVSLIIPMSWRRLNTDILCKILCFLASLSAFPGATLAEAGHSRIHVPPPPVEESHSSIIKRPGGAALAMQIRRISGKFKGGKRSGTSWRASPFPPDLRPPSSSLSVCCFICTPRSDRLEAISPDKDEGGGRGGGVEAWPGRPGPAADVISKLDFNIGGLSHGVLFIGNKYDCGFDTSCQERLMMM